MRSQSLPRAIKRHTPSMKQLILLASLFGTLLSSSLVTRLHINEHGTEYDEDIEYDPDSGAMKLTVPAHNDIQGQTVIINAEKVDLNFIIYLLRIMFEIFRDKVFPMIPLQRSVHLAHWMIILMPNNSLIILSGKLEC